MSKEKKTKFWDMKMAVNGESSAEIFIYGEISSYQWDESDITASSFKADLDKLGDVKTINLYINSPGGSVFEGVAIHNMLKRHKAKVMVYVDALAASIASVIAMSGDTIHMPRNSMLMIHNAWNVIGGNAAELRKAADDLDRISGASMQSYMQKAGDKLTNEKLQELLDGETWLSAEEAFSYGLCDVVLDENKMAASISQEVFNNYKNIPKQLITEEPTTITAQEMKERQNIADEAKAGADYMKTLLGGFIK